MIDGPLQSRPMPFKGFPIEAVEFYEGLIADNSQTYWHGQQGRLRERRSKSR